MCVRVSERGTVYTNPGPSASLLYMTPHPVGVQNHPDRPILFWWVLRADVLMLRHRTIGDEFNLSSPRQMAVKFVMSQQHH